MRGKTLACTVATFCLAVIALAPTQSIAASSALPANGVSATGMKSNGIAQGVASTWGDATAMQQNFEFGNSVSTSTAKLPQQIQDAIAVGEKEAYVMSSTIFGF